MRLLETVELSADELEAVRLTDFEELYQEQAAEQMGVSRQTLGLILKRAHKKIADALLFRKAIQLEAAQPAADYAPPPAQMPPHSGCGRGGHGRGRCGGRGRM